MLGKLDIGVACLPGLFFISSIGAKSSNTKLTDSANLANTFLRPHFPHAGITWGSSSPLGIYVSAQDSNSCPHAWMLSDFLSMPSPQTND